MLSATTSTVGFWITAPAERHWQKGSSGQWQGGGCGDRGAGTGVRLGRAHRWQHGGGSSSGWSSASVKPGWQQERTPAPLIPTIRQQNGPAKIRATNSERVNLPENAILIPEE